MPKLREKAPRPNRAPGNLAPGVWNELGRWHRVREFAVPAWMINEATAHREAGNWQAACRVARVEPHIDLVRVQREHGRAAAELLEDTLKHFAPDLLRWHMPRAAGSTSFVPSCTVPLMRLGKLLGTKAVPALAVITPRTEQSAQDLRFVVTSVEADSPFGLDLAPDLWDVRHAPRFIVRCGDENITSLQDRGRYAEVWSALGFEFVPADNSGPPLNPPPNWWSVSFSRLVAEARNILGIRHAVNARISFQSHWSHRTLILGCVLSQERPRLVEVDSFRQASNAKRGSVLPGGTTVELPEANWRRPPDVDLLRFGLITPEELHPLVRSALFPSLPITKALEREHALPREFRVKCGGAWHRLVPSNGKFRAVEHPPEQQARETVLAALGGKLPGCFSAIKALYEGKGHLPKDLRLQLRDFHLLLLHGDTQGVEAVVQAAFGSAFRERDGKTLLHQLAFLGSGPLAHWLEEGLDINATDREGRTPLHAAVLADASRELIEALLQSGANPQIVSTSGLTAGDLAYRLKRQDLATLLPPTKT